MAARCEPSANLIVCLLLFSLLTAYTLYVHTATPSGGGLEGVEITYRDHIVSEFPLERWVKNWIRVVNNREEPVMLMFEVGSEYDNTVVEDISPFPQPYTLYLDPGENQTIWYFLDMGYRSGVENVPPGESQEVTVHVAVWDAENPEDRVELEIQHTIYIREQDYYEPNAVIEGYVFDGQSGKPVSGVIVRLEGAGNFLMYEDTTDVNGHYRIEFHAHRYPDSGAYYGYTLVVEGFKKAFFPKPGDHIVYNVTLTPGPAVEASYELVYSYDTGYPIWVADVDAEERFIVFSHGHHTVPLEERDPNKHGLYFFALNGTLLWKYLTEAEIWGIDLSDDGKYVAASLMHPYGNTILFDNKGNIIWDTAELGFEPFESREVRISHNSQYVAIGTTPGDLFLLKLETGDLVWRIFLNGQIRGIVFTHDDKIMYVSSGDGYVYKISVETGKVLGRAYVEAWTYRYSLTLSEDERYLATASKIGRVCLVDTETMEVLWSFDTRGGCHWSYITPDNSFVVFGSGGSYGALVLTLDGEFLWFTAHISSSRALIPGAECMLFGREVWSLKGSPIYTLEGDFGDLTYVYVTRDGGKIVGVDEDGTLLIWEGKVAVQEAPPEELPPEQVVPPSVVITSPEEGAVIQGDTVTVEWTVEPGTLSVVKTEISLDEGVWIDVTGETSYTFTGLSEGDHTATVRAVDEAGNVGEDSVGFTVEIPSPPPPAPIRNLRTVIIVVSVASVVIIVVLAFLSRRP